MKFSKIIYKRKISYIGLLVFITFNIFRICYIIIKYFFKRLFNLMIWFKNYLLFIKSGYSYSFLYDTILNMSGRQFEIFMYELFKTMKYKKVILTQQSQDGGKDIILHDDNGITYVELKRWHDGIDVGRERLQKLVGASVADKVDNMLFITTSGYNNNASEYAKKVHNLELWDITDIMKLVAKVDQRKIPMILSKTLGNKNKIVKLNPVRN